MTDIKTKEARSRNMSAIRGKNTKPELYVCHELFKRGYRYRKNVNYIEGHPDLYLKKYNTAIFVHGCFWHRHKGCKYAYTPKSRVVFWEKKFQNNIRRDTQVMKVLKEKNIKCLIIWECTIRKMQKSDLVKEQIIDNVESFLKSDNLYLEC